MTEQEQNGGRQAPAAEVNTPGTVSGPARRRAVLSVADKQGIAELGRALHRLGWELVSTGGTARVLEEAGLPVTPVQAVTGFPELLEGRVKTLHPALHAGILARRRRPDDMAALAAHGIVPVDLVVVNLYPFAQAAAAGVAGTDLLEEIDIGGPALIRAAAKNWPHVAVAVDPADYPEIVAALEQGGLPEALRHRLAVKAFAHTAAYDAVIAQVLAGTRPEDFVPGDLVPGEALPAGTERPAGEGPAAAEVAAQGTPARAGDGAWPPLLVLPLRRESILRYGENPHQAAAVYRPLFPPGVFPPGGFVQRGGKPMSYNNWLDTLAAWRAVQEFALPAAVAVKHATPCGIGAAPTPAGAFRLARDADPESIFGGIVAFNRTVDEATARLLAEIFLEVVVAPGFSREALALLAGRKNLRILEAPGPAAAAGGSPPPGPGHAGTGGRASAATGTGGSWGAWEVRGLGDCWLVQEADPPLPAGVRTGWQVVTRASPSPGQWEALDFAWRAVKPCRSNAIVVAAAQPGGGWRTLGIGAGQTSRVRAVEQALALAGESARGAVLASDGFFPFPDSVERAAAAGIAAIVQPGGSVRDAEVIAAAEQAGIAMVFTGRRHFRH
ncbi:bifunctional phosphoribosylaminoimidazolecarboxamide formyltransferase/IMP cyclohydrolase [Thermaerobacter sp. PB12/4term]|uniref:bifunctional phosphoribosylaminoimidazolecarboxamide formyltransferase/IMP cyclohydrolase n=1 Tax=Thermaerobacter sp. PB12/4term TaxID=2293838 RepID=UPI000E32B56D|nr:bifunctional phosphoribosylaminoimidazolecarboxamide formyltransferase/IMP cyclohydrolase [Thermaerobacter sp. PB12/4term]QIA27330.1 bifunctional phosphoribosylaminoimidazolecarboxamide formyltransferase/IMP cyclohydrolase [Thermaerobacter sp. PB12/4term]